MKNILFVLLASALLMASCVHSDDVTFTGVKSYSIEMPSKVVLNLGIENRSGSKLALKSCDLRVDYRGGEFMKAIIAQPVIVPARFAGEVPVVFRLNMRDPLSAMSVMANPRKALAAMTVSGEVVVKAGIKSKKIKIEQQPVSELMANFGVEF